MPIINYVRGKDEVIEMECWDTRFHWKVLDIDEINEDGSQPSRIELTVFTEDDSGETTDLVEVAIWLFEQTYRYKDLPKLYSIILEEIKKMMSAEVFIRYEEREKSWLEWWKRYRNNYYD